MARQTHHVPPTELLPSAVAKLADEHRQHRRKANEHNQLAVAATSREAVNTARRRDTEAEGRAARDGQPTPSPTYEDERQRTADEATAEAARWKAAADQTLAELHAALTQVAPDQIPHALARFDAAAEQYDQAVETFRQARAAMTIATYEVSYWQQLASGETDVVYSPKARDGKEVTELAIGRRRVSLIPWDALERDLGKDRRQIADAIAQVSTADEAA